MRDFNCSKIKSPKILETKKKEFNISKKSLNTELKWRLKIIIKRQIFILILIDDVLLSWYFNLNYSISHLHDLRFCENVSAIYRGKKADNTCCNHSFFFFFCLRFPSKVQTPLCLWWYCKKSRRRHSLPDFFFTMPSSHSMFWSVFPSELSNIATLASNPSSLLSIEIPTAWSEFILAAMTSERDVFYCFCER